MSIDFNDDIDDTVRKILNHTDLNKDSKQILLNHIIDDENKDVNHTVMSNDLKTVIGLIPVLHDLQEGGNLKQICKFADYTIFYNTGGKGFDNLILLESILDNHSNSHLTENHLFDLIGDEDATAIDYVKAVRKKIARRYDKKQIKVIKSDIPFLFSNKQIKELDYVSLALTMKHKSEDKEDRLVHWCLKHINKNFNQFLLNLGLIKYNYVGYVLTKRAKQLFKYLGNHKYDKMLNHLSYQPKCGWNKIINSSLKSIRANYDFNKKHPYELTNTSYGYALANGVCNIKSYELFDKYILRNKTYSVACYPVVYLCVILTLISSLVIDKKLSGKARYKNIINTIKNIQWTSYIIKKYYQYTDEEDKRKNK